MADSPSGDITVVDVTDYTGSRLERLMSSGNSSGAVSGASSTMKFISLDSPAGSMVDSAAPPLGPPVSLASSRVTFATFEEVLADNNRKYQAEKLRPGSHIPGPTITLVPPPDERQHESTFQSLDALPSLTPAAAMELIARIAASAIDRSTTPAATPAITPAATPAITPAATPAITPTATTPATTPTNSMKSFKAANVDAIEITGLLASPISPVSTESALFIRRDQTIERPPLHLDDMPIIPPPPPTDVRKRWTSAKIAVKSMQDRHCIPTCLVLDGCGICCWAYLYALEKVRKLGILPHIRNFASSGLPAVICVMLACKARIETIQNQLDTFTIGEARSWFRSALNMKRAWGLTDGKKLRAWIDNALTICTGSAATTFRDIYDKYNMRPIIVVASARARAPLYLSYQSHPNLPVALALQMTLAIVGIVPPVPFEGDLYFNGGVMDNYPVEVFAGEHILGMMIMNRVEHTVYPAAKTMSEYINIANICYTAQQQRIRMSDSNWASTIKINCGGIAPTGFTISLADKKKLEEASVAATIDHFTQKPIAQDAYCSYLRCSDSRYARIRTTPIRTASDARPREARFIK